MKRNSTLAIVLSALTALQAPAGAAISFTPQATAVPGSAPQGFSYQGRLEQSGTPVNGSVLLVFRIYDAVSGGNLIWTSGGVTVQATLGLFNAVVPSPITALVGGGSRWLEVQINGVTMSPREQLNSVPYALIAKSVEGTIDVSTAGLAIMPNALATNPALIISSQTGNVGIGTTNPGAAFSVGASSLVVTSGGNVGIGTSNPAGAFSVGASSLIVTSGGSVGINTASPAANLDVNGGAQFGLGAAKSTFTATGSLALASSFTVVGGYASLPASPSILAEGAGGSFPNAASVVFGSAGAGWLYHIGTQSAGVFSPILNVEDNGSVGVGTAGPLSKLDVAGGAAFGSYGGVSAAPANGLIVSGAAGVGTAGPLSKLDVSGNAAFGTYGGVSAAPANGFIVSGSVGVGTANPATKLHVSSGVLTIDGTLPGLTVAPSTFVVSGGAVGVGINPIASSRLAAAGSISATSFDTGFGAGGNRIMMDFVGGAQMGRLITVNGGGAGIVGTQVQNAYFYNNNNAGFGTSTPNSLVHMSSGTLTIDGNTAKSITTVGTVGIETASPAAVLDVNGNAQFGSGATKSTFTAAGGLTFDAAYNPAAAQDATTKNYVDSQLLSGGGPWTQKSPSIYPTTTANNITVFSTMTIQGASFSVGTSNLSVKASGVGVGTAGNLSKFDVSGNAAFGTYGGVSAAPSNGLIVSGAAGVGTAGPLSKFDVAGNAAFGTYGGVSAAPSNGLIVSGASGVGTAAPKSQFDVAGGVSLGTYGGVTAAPSNGLIVSGKVGAGVSGPLSSLDVGGSGLAVGTYAGANAAPSNGVIVSGAVGVGTTGPLSKLDVNGGVAVGTYAGANAAPANGMIVSGNVGIGQNSAAVALDLAAQTEFGLGVFTTAQVQAKSPARAGTLIYNSTLAQVCVSTGTTIQAYSRVSTPGTSCQ